MKKQSIKHRINETYNNLIVVSKALADLLNAPRICEDIHVYAKVSEAHRNVVDARQIMLGVVGAACGKQVEQVPTVEP